MSRTLKQLTFGSAYLIILAIIAGGIYFLYLKPAPSCTDNRQNQKETAIDCGGPCIPCEVKGLSPAIEEVKVFPAGNDKITLLAKVKNPSGRYSAAFAYEFDLAGTLLPETPGLRGRALVKPQAAEYIVIPGLAASAKEVKNVNFKVGEPSWSEGGPKTPKIEISGQTNLDKERIVVTGTLANKSAENLPLINLTAVIFDGEGNALNASVARLEGIPAFSQKQFVIFFPEVPGLTQNLDPQKTQIQWDLNE